ncbi:hypothetical protein PHMEG_00013014 [Phytophthora megakarya]|uniref:Uncharacterized protein n=1 Tax=Phytophthora megakarya TaxID=4795 RepID=A0A225W9Z0_9STRA|nr:hypothetical protein PHMEG_00013014 [Phytophthora megakarya]
MSGLRGLRSPRGSPSSEPDPKRPQHVPPRPVSLSTPSLSSLPSYHSSDTNSQSVVTLNETMSSIQNVSSRARSDLVPSLFGTSGGSIESTRGSTSGSKSSQDESLSSSVWCLGQPAAGHMPFRAYAPIAMTAQGGAVQANTQMRMQVVQTILSPPSVMDELDDVSELAQKRQANEAILAVHAEAAIQAERFRAAKETDDRLKAQQFQTEADFAQRFRVQRMQDESERALWVDDVQKNTNMQIAILQQQMREMEAELSQLRDLRATSAQVLHATVTPVPDAVSQIKTESGIANLQQNAKGHDPGNAAVKKEKPADKDVAAARAAALLAAQLHAISRAAKTATTVSTAVKAEAGARATKAPAPKSSDTTNVKDKNATFKARASKKVRRGGYPYDSDSTSEDDEL